MEILNNPSCTLLAFYSCYIMNDLPATSRKQPRECQEAAKRHLENTRIGNLLGYKVVRQKGSHIVLKVFIKKGLGQSLFLHIRKLLWAHLRGFCVRLVLLLRDSSN